MASGPSVISREAGTSSPPAKPVRRRPSLSHILIAVTVILAFGLNYLALQNRDAEILVAVAAEPIAEGSVLTAEVVTFVPLAAFTPLSEFAWRCTSGLAHLSNGWHEVTGSLQQANLNRSRHWP